VSVAIQPELRSPQGLALIEQVFYAEVCPNSRKTPSRPSASRWPTHGHSTTRSSWTSCPKSRGPSGHCRPSRRRSSPKWTRASALSATRCRAPRRPWRSRWRCHLARRSTSPTTAWTCVNARWCGRPWPTVASTGRRPSGSSTNCVRCPTLAANTWNCWPSSTRSITPPHQLRRYLLGLTCDHDPDATLRKKALDNRGVIVTPRGHGMADVSAYVSLEVAEAFMQALEDLAASPECADPYAQGEERTKEQRCADALAGFLTTHCTYRINVDVVIPADTLIGDNEYGAESKGLGPITSELARNLCFSRTPAGAGWSPTRCRGRWSISAPRPTESPSGSARRSRHATSPAVSRAATAAQSTRTAITSLRGRTARPAPPISRAYAVTTTASRPTPPGRSVTTQAHRVTTWSGAAHWGLCTTRVHTTTTGGTERDLSTDSSANSWRGRNRSCLEA
jgi:hypothetical protein